MIIPEEILKAVSILVKEKGMSTFRRLDIREQLGIDRHRWIYSYNPIFQAMRIDHPGVQRRDNLRTDRRIVLRTGAHKIPWIELRPWLIRPLMASFFRGKVHLPHIRHKTGILMIDEVGERGAIGLLKRILMWHPPLLKSFTKIRGGMDATIEAFAFG